MEFLAEEEKYSEDILTRKFGCVKTTENLVDGSWISFVISILAVGIIFTGFFTPGSTHCHWLITED
jgi:hypothetical protein